MEYIKSVFCLYIVITIIENLISSKEFLRYFKLFSGILMIIVILRPVVAFFGDDSFDDVDIEADYAVPERVRQSILAAEYGRNQEIAGVYAESVEEYIRLLAGDYNFTVENMKVDIDIDKDSENFGKIVRMKFDIYHDTDDGLYDIGVVSIKNNLANFYNLPEANIYINTYSRQDKKEE